LAELQQVILEPMESMTRCVLEQFQRSQNDPGQIGTVFF